MNIPDHISESLETIFGIKILKFFDVNADPGSGNFFDPGSGMEKNSDPGLTTRIRNTGRVRYGMQLHVLSCSISSLPGKPFLGPCHPGPQSANFLHLNTRQNT
jgi:hypothetical protein